MITRYSEDFIILAYESLKNRIYYTANLKGDIIFKPIDPLVKLILNGNACEVLTETKEFVDTIGDGEVLLYYLKDAKGNEETQYMDIVHIYGGTYIVIFLDYFDNILTTFADPEDKSIDGIAKQNLGNSLYFDAIRHIMSIICEIVCPFHTSNTAFAMCDTFRKVPYLVAGRIIDSIRELDVEVDASYPLPISVEELLFWIRQPEASFKLRLIGIKEEL